MLRFLLIIGMAGLFVAAIYRLLNKTTVRMKSEFDNEAEDTELRLAEIKQKMKKLEEEIKEARSFALDAELRFEQMQNGLFVARKLGDMLEKENTQLKNTIDKLRGQKNGRKSY